MTKAERSTLRGGSTTGRRERILVYSLVLFLHSWWRWVVLLLLLAAVARAVSGRLAGRTWTGSDRRANLLATIALDLQLLMGLLLYLFLSPFTDRGSQLFLL